VPSDIGTDERIRNSLGLNVSDTNDYRCVECSFVVIAGRRIGNCKQALLFGLCARDKKPCCKPLTNLILFITEKNIRLLSRAIRELARQVR